ncbi:motility associated factor glycosyltransferase family protein [Sulfurimonas crateris]|uniref:Motility associated factor glycosyltransferase family protein n=1 Tax=Sulfurimonas crateris TaxID=2574727 RepID=A0A4U2Z9X3_9BACT|nr:6-hydroxymethylpterin diphosphokinase MptE-like protein [Sulfurimonas crateris]TKI71306.1 motility associated factor glycosyltransferase family protein [Sulfurimonas crateris]
MESIETKAIQTYEKNLEYFAHNHKDLMDKLQRFNLALENGSYAPRYDLEYIKGYFDVKELKSGRYLYDGDSNKISKELCKQVDFYKSSFSFEGFPLYKFSEEKLANLDDKSSGFEGIFPVMNYYIDNTDERDEMSKIEKFIFIGVGLGVHASLIDEKIKATEYLIIEDDIELFRLSLFVTPYFEIAQNSKLYFSIGDDENIFLIKINRFLQNTFFYNRYLKYSYFPAHSNNKIKQIQNALTSQSFTVFPYKTQLKKILRPLEYINDGYRVLNLSRHFENSIFSKKPVLLITAGPSLKKNIDWLKVNHKKFIVITVTATLKTLYDNGIVPDIVTHIDGFETSLPHLENFPVKEFLKNSIIILGSFSPAKMRDIFSKEQIYYYEDQVNYFQNFGQFSGGRCVGSSTLLLSLILNTKELYLLGQDLAVDQESGSTHSEDHIYSSKKDMLTKDNLENVMSLRKNLFPIKGNFTDTVYTTSLFHGSIQSLYAGIPRLKLQDQSIYNLNDGAYIHLAIPKQIQDINVDSFETVDKQALAISINKLLDSYSTKELSSDDVDLIKKRLVYSKEIKNIILDHQNRVSKTNKDKYLYDLLGVTSQLLSRHDNVSNSLTVIYHSFFSYVLPIIMDFFNTKGLKNSKKHIKVFNSFIEKELLDIEDIYEKSLEDFIEKRC